ncbi:hypothetical protein GPALN_002979 [Globodera pallida]|nr:hypothetical protein GPALN_002979 [Globodera pallida]
MEARIEDLEAEKAEMENKIQKIERELRNLNPDGNIYEWCCQMQKEQKTLRDDILEIRRVQHQIFNRIDIMFTAQAKNHLNDRDRHGSIYVNGSRATCVLPEGPGFGYTVRAKHPLRQNWGVFYFEIEIKHGSFISIGICDQNMPPHNCVVGSAGSIGYKSVGVIEAGGGQPSLFGTLQYGIGDIVGFGVNFANRNIFCTHNTTQIETKIYLNGPMTELYASVSLSEDGDSVEANFGPEFVYDLSALFFAK